MWVSSCPHAQINGRTRDTPTKGSEDEKDLLRDDVLLAYGLDGKQLSHEHGGPVRLIIPEKYGYKGVKWIRRVKFTETRELGFYESRGYSYTADPWTNDRYAQGGT